MPAAPCPPTTVTAVTTVPVVSVSYMAGVADNIPIWWSEARDEYLRKFWPTEPYLAGAIYGIAARNAAYRITLAGPRRQVKRAQQMLAASDLGKGMQSMVLKLSLDLLTQDNGAFCEIIRPARIVVKGLPGWYGRYDGIPLPGVRSGVDRRSKGVDTGWDRSMWAARLPTGRIIDLSGYSYELKDSPHDLPLGLAHLDAARCRRTGNPEAPVIYTDLNGREHTLSQHQVFTLEELPSPQDVTKGAQYCMVTRVFRLAQTLRDMEILMQEKASGRFAGRVYLTNVSADAIQDAVNIAREGADARGLTRYMPPILADTVDPHAEPAVTAIELASLPEGFSFDLFLEWYIAGLALGGGVDYGFLAPLPGKGLGTTAQSETQERQARGKSSRLFQGMMTHYMNYGGILPRSVTFRYAEADYIEAEAADTGKKTRAETRKVMIETGEITAQVARQMAVDEGDYPASYLAMMQEADVTPAEKDSDSTPVETEQEQEQIAAHERI
jgi:hypothetical protein